MSCSAKHAIAFIREGVQLPFCQCQSAVLNVMVFGAYRSGLMVPVGLTLLPHPLPEIYLCRNFIQ
jgi:hypothetical protein